MICEYFRCIIIIMARLYKWTAWSLDHVGKQKFFFLPDKDEKSYILWCSGSAHRVKCRVAVRSSPKRHDV